MEIDEPARLAERPETFILDVRSPGEFARGRLERAVLIPASELAGRLRELPADKGTCILVYCATGGRSALASALLSSAGYSNVRDMAGGLKAWKGAGGTIVQGEGK
jgi:rhodanese-related sulfurtransferase